MNSIRSFRGQAGVTASDPDVVYSEAARLMSEHRMYLPVHSAPMKASIQSAQLLHSALLYFEYGVPTEISSSPLEGYSTIHIPIAGRLEVEHQGSWHPVNTDAAAVFSHGSAVRMRWSGDLRLLVARIDHETILEHLGRLVSVGSKPLVFSPFVDRLGAGGGVSGSVIAIGQALEASSTAGLNPRLAQQLEDLLISSLLLGHEHSYSAEITAPVALPSPRVVRAVVEHINDNFDVELSAASLAAVAGVSERALFDAFQRQFGVTPMKFLRNVRLDKARSALLAHPEFTVGQVAHSVGLHHAGRFAAHYRVRFGENPADTSRQAPSMAPGVPVFTQRS